MTKTRLLTRRPCCSLQCRHREAGDCNPAKALETQTCSAPKGAKWMFMGTHSAAFQTSESKSVQVPPPLDTCCCLHAGCYIQATIIYSILSLFASFAAPSHARLWHLTVVSELSFEAPVPGSSIGTCDASWSIQAQDRASKLLSLFC